MIVKGKRSPGGYRFKHFDGQPVREPITVEPPNEVVIPLAQGYGREVPSLVKKNDHVDAGQIIGRDDDSVSTPVHSSISGTVTGFKKIQYNAGEINAVVVTSNDPSDQSGVEAEADWTRLSNKEIEERLYTSGVTALGNSGIPTRHRSSVIGTADVEHIIIHGIGTGPYKPSTAMLFGGDSLQKLVEGIKILNRVMPEATIHITVDKSEMKTVAQVDAAFTDVPWLKLYPMEARYPREFDEVIIPTLLGREYPYGFICAHIGVISLNIYEVRYIYEAVVEKKPLIERFVSLSGPGFKNNIWAAVRIGSPYQVFESFVKEGAPVRFIAGDLLTGVQLTDMSLPVERSCGSITAIPEETSSGFFSFAAPGFKKDSYTRTFASSFLNFKKTVDTNLHGEERSCIFCGYCEDVCPVGIIPHLIYRNVEREKIEDFLVAYKIFNCIGCNLCTYVCPSKINVSSYIEEGKKKLRDYGFDESTVILPNFKLKGLDAIEGTDKGTSK